MAKESYYVVALPGDGIGPEVLARALQVLKAVGELFEIRFNVEEIPCGGHYYAEHEIEWPEGSFEKCQAADAILLGAVGHEIDGKTVFTKAGKPYAEPQLAGFAQVIANRKKLNLYANVRPVKLYAGVKHKIHGVLKQVWEPDKVDYVVVRENTEDAYTGETETIADGRVTPIRITRAATERVARFAVALSGGSTPGQAEGGSNPTQIGLGSVLGSIQRTFTPGSIETTGVATDMAIEADYFHRDIRNLLGLRSANIALGLGLAAR